ncbi:hypothetical protein QOT17_007731 [Balamuthia mandrillaris]
MTLYKYSASFKVMLHKFPSLQSLLHSFTQFSHCDHGSAYLLQDSTGVITLPNKFSSNHLKHIGLLQDKYKIDEILNYKGLANKLFSRGGFLVKSCYLQVQGFFIASAHNNTSM